jgi:hypothetical protein
MKRVSSTILAFMVVAFTPVHTVRCQEIASLRAGESIRLLVGSPTGQQIKGRLVSLSADTIVLRASNIPFPIAFSTVRVLEVERRSGRSFTRSVFFGVLGGVAGGALLGLTGSTDTGDGTITPGDKTQIGSVVGGTLGLIVGAIFGGCCSSGWQSVSLHRVRS